MPKPLSRPSLWPVLLLLVGCAGPGGGDVAVHPEATSTISWKGHTWAVTSGGMAGVCAGSPNNVFVDANGYLHLTITNNGGTWSAAELFTTDRLGFGTYQWQIDAPIDRFDRNVVLGLFPYGPAAGIGNDGTNEIDIEYSFWGNANGSNGDWTNYPASGTTIGETTYRFSLGGGTLSTSRFLWNATSIQDWLLSGLQPVDSTAGQLNSWRYAPPNPTVNIPQQPLPLGMNLWCFGSPPSNGKNVEVVIRDFRFVPLGGGGGGGGGGSGAISAPFSGKCLDVAGGASANGTKLQQYQCNGSAAQIFHLAAAPNAAGASTLVHDASGKCVDIDHSGTADFTKAQLWDCNATGAQSFSVADAGNGNVRFVNTNSGKCLDINGASAADGTQVQLYSCNGTVAQTWHLAP
jgi:hypothetical protein